MEHSNFKHIRLAHDEVYSLLKVYDSGRLIMLYGNHNMFEIQEIHRKNYYKFYDDYNEEEIELFPGIIMHEAVVLSTEILVRKY